ncbi:MAG TPA: hypothetical protein GX716_03220 [Firmicutes bacterium]|nr:hypothetical protein [Candidatus Fermentithermobacillaceae bacterium]
MLADLPEELRRKVFETHPEVTTADILHRLIESPEIRAFVRGEPVAEDIQEALGRFIDLLAAEVPREEGIYCPKCHKGPFKSEMALRGHLANCPAKSKEPANDD